MKDNGSIENLYNALLQVTAECHKAVFAVLSNDVLRELHTYTRTRPYFISTRAVTKSTSMPGQHELLCALEAAIQCKENEQVNGLRFDHILPDRKMTPTFTYDESMVDPMHVVEVAEQFANQSRAEATKLLGTPKSEANVGPVRVVSEADKQQLQKMLTSRFDPIPNDVADQPPVVIAPAVYPLKGWPTPEIKHDEPMFWNSWDSGRTSYVVNGFLASHEVKPDGSEEVTIQYDEGWPKFDRTDVETPGQLTKKACEEATNMLSQQAQHPTCSMCGITAVAKLETKRYGTKLYCKKHSPEDAQPIDDTNKKGNG